MKVGREVERYQSVDGKHLLRIFRRDSDFYFTETSEVTEGGETFWTSTTQSETYASLEKARSAAAVAAPWLKHKA
ncbi:MAG TPA: hypothetical protein VL286_02870 [Rhizomicrobium sp.]|jgi:hypothetical protein|nr:hypothetical protein [Rhizomicrobium sp.]